MAETTKISHEEQRLAQDLYRLGTSLQLLLHYASSTWCLYDETDSNVIGTPNHLGLANAIFRVQTILDRCKAAWTSWSDDRRKRLERLESSFRTAVEQLRQQLGAAGYSTLRDRNLPPSDQEFEFAWERRLLQRSPLVGQEWLTFFDRVDELYRGIDRQFAAPLGLGLLVYATGLERSGRLLGADYSVSVDDLMKQDEENATPHFLLADQLLNDIEKFFPWAKDRMNPLWDEDRILITKWKSIVWEILPVALLLTEGSGEEVTSDSPGVDTALDAKIEKGPLGITVEPDFQRVSRDGYPTQTLSDENFRMFMLYFRGHPVSRDHAIEKLWNEPPNVLPLKARGRFATGLSRLNDKLKPLHIHIEKVGGNTLRYQLKALSDQSSDPS